MIKNLSVKVKLLLATVPLMILCIVLAVISGTMQKNVYKESKEAYFNELAQINKTLVTADRDLYQAEVGLEQAYLKAYTGTVDDDYKKALDDYDENLQQVYDGADTLSSLFAQDDYLYNTFRGPEQPSSNSQLLADFRTAVDAWTKVYSPKLNQGDYAASFASFKEAREYLNMMEDSVDAYESVLDENLNKKINSSVTVLTVVSGIVIVLCIVLVIFLIQYFLRNIIALEAALKAIAAKDLTVEPDDSDAADEFGSLATSQKELYQSLYGIVGDIRSGADNLAESGGQIAMLSADADEQMGNIASAIDDMAHTATQTAADITDLSRNVADISEMTDSCVNATQVLADESSQIDRVTADGMHTVEELTRITDESGKAFDEIFHLIEGITTSASKIGDASKLITDIASQTNLLALNASIEAARAGEAGRGFAVVAEEIGLLANQSADSAGTINNMLKELSQATQLADKQSKVVREYVDSQTRSVDDTRSSFDEIVQATQRVNEQISTLSSLNSEMAGRYTQVNDLCSSLSAASEENAASSQEIAATAEQVKLTVNDVNSNSQNVNAMAEELVSIVNQFNL